MTSKITNLKRTINTAYNILFEANQDKMTASQIQTDVKQRNSAQTIGMEIEFYSPIWEDEVREHIGDDLGILRGDGEAAWNVEGDDSLDAYGGESGFTINQLEEAMKDESITPTDAVEEYLGIDELSRYIRGYVHDELYVFERLDEIEDTLDEIEDSYDIDKLIIENAKVTKYKGASREKPLDTHAMRLLGSHYIFTVDKLEEFEGVNEALANLYHDDEGFNKWLRDVATDPDGESDTESRDRDDFRYGIEINFSGPRKLSEKEKILDEVDEIMHDAYIDAETKYNGGETGLHIHFGLASHNVTNMDMVRMIVNTSESMESLVKLGKREPGKYQASIDGYISALDSFIDPDGKLDTISIPTGKYFGTSFFHRRGKGTVEFRWAHASAAEDRENLSNYIDLLMNIVNTSFTGSNTLEYKGAIIKEVRTESRKNNESNIVAIVNNKIVKQGMMLDYKSDIRTHKESSMNDLRELMTSVTRDIKMYNAAKESYNTALEEYGSDEDLSTMQKLGAHYDSVKDELDDDEIAKFKAVFSAFRSMNSLGKGIEQSRQEIEAAQSRLMDRKK